MTTLLEYLPDEILLIICQYLAQRHVIRAFFGLNYRLNSTISHYTQSAFIFNDNTLDYDENYELLSIVGPYLHSLTIKNTCLSTNKLSLASNIRELTLINTKIPQIQSLENLTDLNIIYGHDCESMEFLFLTYANLHSVYTASIKPLKVPIFSPNKFSAIKQLAITLQSFDDLINLLAICPELTCLDLTLQTCDLKLTETQENQLITEIPSNLRILHLRTAFDLNVSFDSLKCIFQYLSSKLEHIFIEIHTQDISCIDGQQWENYLKEFMPNLNRFEFFIQLEKEYQNGTKPVPLFDVLKTFESLYWSSITPQLINGYYYRYYTSISTCIHTEPIPTVKRRRYFLN